uniref:SNF2_N domain-containing protein n=1 Tax=Syphacia muris TaxID=451379 RepID=A0A0N5AFU0_9BILA
MELTSKRKRIRSSLSESNEDVCSDSTSNEKTSSHVMDADVSVEGHSDTQISNVADSVSTSLDQNSSNLYRQLGQEDFLTLRRRPVTSKWVAAGVTFPADLSKKNQLKVKRLHGLHPYLMEAVEKNISHWFPVQTAVLPLLIRNTNVPSLLPPR